MTEEKILDFFGVFPQAKKLVDTFLLKIWVTFNFFCMFFCIGGLFLFKIFKPTPFIIISTICFSVSFIVLTIWSFLVKNPQQEKLFLTVFFGDMFLKSLYCTFVFSQVENERFTMWHIVVAVFFFSLVGYNFIYQKRFLKCLENHTILETHDIIAKSTSKVWFAIVGVASVIPAYPLSRILSWHFSIGLGFCSWILACGWLTMSICFGSIYYLMKKYNYVEILYKHRESSQ